MKTKQELETVKSINLQLPCELHRKLKIKSTVEQVPMYILLTNILQKAVS